MLKINLQKNIGFILVLSILLCQMGCATSSSKQKLAVRQPISAVDVQETSPKILEYIIGLGDSLEISVWQCEELKEEVKVRPDGKISFPLIGDVKAEGLTPTQLAEELKGKLAFYVKDPKLLVGVKEFGGRKAFILGEVNSPGVYTFDQKPTIIEVISRAGGYTENAILGSTKVIRGELKEENVISVDLSRLIKEGDKSQNIYIHEGDIIYIPRSPIANVNYVLRQILPSLYFVDFGTTLKKDLNDWR